MPPRVICLTNVFDQQYHEARQESIARCLSSPKRRDLFRCLELATAREVLILSSPPKALSRRRPRWLPAVETRFSTHRQRFCGMWDVPKLRVPLSWLAFARHVLRQTRDGDLLILDNYELLYVVAAMVTRLRRNVTFLLDYEDGKHAIDRSWARLLSGTAEIVGRRLISAAILAHPALRHRLPAGLEYEVVPGFIRAPATPPQRTLAGSLRLLYSGSLDRTRGVDLLMSAVDQLPSDFLWELDITGTGPLEGQVREFAAQERHKLRVRYHGSMPPEPYEALLASCHVGLNCQKESDPISEVTFPSKIFTYFSSGLQVLSSRASEVEAVCGLACTYYDEESAHSLAAAIQALPRVAPPEQSEALKALQGRYSIEGTAERLRLLLNRSKLI